MQLTSQRPRRTAGRAALALLLLAAAAPAARARQFTAARPIPGDEAAVPAAETEVETDIAAGSDAHLAVWVDARTNLAGVASTNGYSLVKQDVLARRIAPDGTPLGAPFLVGHLPFEARRPRVAWNGADAWLVVWEARRATQTTTYVGIQGVRVDAEGRVLDDEPFTVDDTHGVNERFADVAGQAGGWMVVWHDLDLLSNTGNVSAALIDGDGGIVRKEIIGASPQSAYQPRYPSLDAAAGRYLVAWEHLDPQGSGDNLFGQLFDASMNRIGAEFRIGDGGPSSHPIVASSDTGFLVTWDSQRAAAVSSAGSVVPQGGRVLGLAGTSGYGFARAAWLGDRWLVGTTNLSGHVVLEELDALATTIDWTVAVDRPDRTHDLALDAIGARAVAFWSEDVLEWSDGVCARVDVGLAPGPLQHTGATPPNQIGADLDGDPARGYALAWIDAVSGTRRVMFQRLLASGAPATPEPIVVAEVDSLGLRQARVALGETEALVVWDAPGAPWPPTIHAKRVSLTGQVLDPAPIEVMPGGMADVDFEDGAYLVVGTHEPSNHFRYAYGRRLDSSGAFHDPQPLSLSSSYARFPRVGSSGGRFLVVWSKYPTHDSPYSYTQARFVDAFGGPSGTFAVESAPNSTRGPSVAGGPDGFLVTFTHDGDVLARKVGVGGQLMWAPAGVHLTYADRAQFGAEAVAVDGGWMVAWTDYRAHPPLEAGLGDVYAARLDDDGALLDPEGIAIATGPMIQGAATLAGAGDDVLLSCVAWSEAHGAFRVHTARHGAPFVGERVCSPAPVNSTGSFASLTAFGSDVAFDNDLTLGIDGAPPLVFGFIVTSETQAFTPNPGGSQGNLCIGGTVGRFLDDIFLTTAAGRATVDPDLTRMPIGPGIPAFPGETWTFQAWYRDSNPGPTSNFTDAIAVRLR